MFVPCRSTDSLLMRHSHHVWKENCCSCCWQNSFLECEGVCLTMRTDFTDREEKCKQSRDISANKHITEQRTAPEPKAMRTCQLKGRAYWLFNWALLRCAFFCSLLMYLQAGSGKQEHRVPTSLIHVHSDFWDTWSSVTHNKA